MGCHFLLQCMRVKSESEVAQSCLTLRDPVDCSPPGSSIHGISQARVLEWVAIAFSDTHIHTYKYLFTNTHTHLQGSFCGNWEVRNFEKLCKHLYQNCLVGKLTLVALQNISGWVNSFLQLQFFPIILLWTQRRRRRKGMSLY